MRLGIGIDGTSDERTLWGPKMDEDDRALEDLTEFARQTAPLRARIAELELALMRIRACARADHIDPIGLHMTCLSIIENDATLALAGVDTYDSEIAK